MRGQSHSKSPFMAFPNSICNRFAFRSVGIAPFHRLAVHCSAISRQRAIAWTLRRRTRSLILARCTDSSLHARHVPRRRESSVLLFTIRWGASAQCVNVMPSIMFSHSPVRSRRIQTDPGRVLGGTEARRQYGNVTGCFGRAPDNVSSAGAGMLLSKGRDGYEACAKCLRALLTHRPVDQMKNATASKVAAKVAELLFSTYDQANMEVALRVFPVVCHGAA